MVANDNPFAQNPADPHNPFAAPEAPFDSSEFSNTNAEAIRNAHLSHEASVKSVGVLYMLGGIFMVLVVIGMVYALIAIPQRGAPAGVGPAEIAAFSILPLLAIVQCVTAVGLRKLRSWARIPSGLLSGIGLLGFPVGTLINGYILYLLFSAKGSMVFSEEYQRVIAETPHIKYKTSIIVWIFLGLLLLLIALGIFGSIIV